MKTKVIFLAIVFLAVTTVAENPFSVKQIISQNDSFNVLWAGNYNIRFDSKFNNSTNSSNVFHLNFEQFMTIEDESTEVENWMMNEANFGTFFNMEIETEEALELEDWMTNDSNFDAYAVYFETETEEALELEGWMTSDNNFLMYAEYFQVETENATELESWMTVEGNFGTFINIESEKEEPLKVEAWMTDNKNWK